MANRKITKLSFVILEFQKTGSDSIEYVLQLNKHLNGYSFFGGHINDEETPKETAIRELKEELQIDDDNNELKDRWNYKVKDKVNPDEIANLEKEIKEKGNMLILPFRSLRAEMEGEPSEKTAEIYFYSLQISPDKYPTINKRIDNLINAEFSKYCGEKLEAFCGKTLCKSFTENALIDEAWNNKDNPFLRFALKNDIISFPDEKKKSQPFIFNVPAVELRLEEDLSNVLGTTFSDEKFDIHIISPKPENVEFYRKINKTISATIEIRRTGSAEICQFTFPYPEHGVFILQSKSSVKSSNWIWHPRLISKPGLWKIKRYRVKDGKKNIETCLKLSFVLRRYILIPEDDIKSLKVDEFVKKLPKYIYNPNSLFEKNVDNFPLIVSTSDKKKKLAQIIIKNCQQIDIISPLDEQDISYQRLNTYTNFLAETLIQRLILSVNSQDKKESWDSVCSIKSLINIKNLRESGYFHLFSPLNLIDAVSNLTSFQRYAYSKNLLEDLSPIFRQNHPSFQGFICPIQTPESKMVGLTLNTARGVMTDASGNLFKTNNPNDSSDLGYAASLVPFYQHNDAARSMMGSKNLKQALPLAESNEPQISTGYEKEVIDIVKPLVKNQILSDTFFKYKPGIDLLVAYMPWYGWNYEDAIVANETLKDKMKWESIEEHSIYIHPDYELCEPDPDNEFQKALIGLLYDSNLYKKDHTVYPDSEIAFFKKDGRIFPILCGGDDEGELIEIAYNKPEESFLGGLLSWKVKIAKPLMIGDKLMGRHGNKGVISTLLPLDELPKLPNDERLPKNLRGRPVDLVLNPHGVISRMNLGQLLETHIGLLRQFPNIKHLISDDVGKAFNKIDVDQLKEYFNTINGEGNDKVIDENGKIFLSLPNGKKTRQPVVVGIQHIVRLNHIPDRKYQVRGGGRDSKHLYNLITGQPVHGRKNKGGLRLGEMEIWALAAHQADENIKSMVQGKSDPFFWNDDNHHNQTFCAIKDHLLALGITFKDDDSNGRFKFNWDENGKWIQAVGEHINNHETWELSVRSDYSCHNCGQILYPNIQATGKIQRSDKLRLTVKDVLIADKFNFVDVNNVDAIQEDKGSIMVKINKQKGNGIQINWHRKDASIILSFKYAKRQHFAYKKLKTPKEGEKPQTIHYNEFIDFGITCSKHKTAFLQGGCTNFFPTAITGGLCDSKIFGSIDLEQLPYPRWGYIELPAEIDFPIKLPKKFDNKKIKYIPILPLKYRYNKPNLNHESFGGKLTELYAELINNVKHYKANNNKWIEISVKRIFYEIYRRLFGKDLLKKTGNSKFGLIKRKGLGRRVDYSGRLVIVPDPNLAWNECGVPTEILTTLLQDIFFSIITNYTKKDLYTNKLLNLIFNSSYFTEEMEINETSDFVAKFFTNVKNQQFIFQSEKNQYFTFIREILESYFSNNPYLRIILNRQPSLHRYSMMAFKPIPLSPDEGIVLKINPLVCNGFGADFDGDEMVFHWPLTDPEHHEAHKLEPTHYSQLISVANEKPLCSFDQDFVLGHYLIGKNKNKNDLLKLLTLKYNKGLINESWIKEKGVELLNKLFSEKSEDTDNLEELLTLWMNIAFKEASEEGISFGFLELRDYIPESNKIASCFEDLKTDENIDALNGKLGKMTIDKLTEIEEKSTTGISALAISGARGNKQTRQLLSARGLLDPGDIGFESYINSQFIIKDSLLTGMTPNTSFYAAMNTRSSMIDKKKGTPKAGYLTRQLVLALWSWKIEKKSCGAQMPSISNCKFIDKNKLCKNCYGKILGYKELPDNYPAGLIAAQSIGERGTQLSMQSFHTGERVISLSDVENILKGKDPEKNDYNWFIMEEDLENFIKRMKAIDAYGNICRRHFELLWTAINKSKQKTLDSAWNNVKSPLSAFGGKDQWRGLIDTINSGLEEDLSNPLSKIMTSLMEGN